MKRLTGLLRQAHKHGLTWDLLGIAGIACVLWALTLVWIPAALLVGGIVLVTGALRGERARIKQQRMQR